jgi:hypothetical protein
VLTAPLSDDAGAIRLAHTRSSSVTENAQPVQCDISPKNVSGPAGFLTCSFTVAPTLPCPQCVRCFHLGHALLGWPAR